MQAIEILSTKGADVVTIAEDATLDDAISLLAAKNIGAVLVTNPAGTIAGILSERDVMRVLAGAPTGYRSSPVSDVMTSDVRTADVSSSVEEIMDLMTEGRFRHLPILDGEQLAGLLSIGDVVKHRIRAAEGEAAALKEYITAG